MAPSAKNNTAQGREKAGTTGAQAPANFTGLKLKAPPKKVAGIPGVTTALRHLMRYTHPAAAIRTLNQLNQKGGLDCPGCAWPDPDDDRSSLGEYCENGVKAISEEMSKKVIRRDFFSQYSVAEMQQWSDFGNWQKRTDRRTHGSS